MTRPVNLWSTHAITRSETIFPLYLYGHALSTTATVTSELLLFGGYVGGIPSKTLYVLSTQDFSMTTLKVDFAGEHPTARYAHGVAFTSTLLLVWGGLAVSSPHRKCEDYDDSLYLLNLGMSDLLMSRPAPADQSFLPSSIANVDPRRGQWSRARRSLLPYRDVGRFQSLRLRWLVRE